MAETRTKANKSLNKNVEVEIGLRSDVKEHRYREGTQGGLAQIGEGHENTRLALQVVLRRAQREVDAHPVGDQELPAHLEAQGVIGLDEGDVVDLRVTPWVHEGSMATQDVLLILCTQDVLLILCTPVPLLDCRRPQSTTETDAHDHCIDAYLRIDNQQQ